MISVIIPYYSTDLGYLEKSLFSVLNQTSKNNLIEIVICNDGDNSKKLIPVLDRFKNLNIIFCENKKNSGISAARNKAFSYSKGNYILFLDADDQLVENAVESCVDILRFNENIDIVYSNALKLNKGMTKKIKTIDSSFYSFLLDSYKSSIFNPLFHSIFICQCICLRRESFDKINGFDENLRCGELTDFLIRVSNLKKKKNMIHINKNLYLYRENPIGLSKNRMIHANRMSAIKKGIKQSLDIDLNRICLLGRIKPFGMVHYTLFLNDKPILLPYINYNNLSINTERINGFFKKS